MNASGSATCEFSFRVQDTSFTVSSELRQSGAFTVQSVPRPYSVRTRADVQTRDDVQREVLRYFAERTKPLLVIDERVFELYLADAALPSDHVLKLSATEEAKTVESMLRVVDFLNRHAASKADRVLVLGGGITQDIAAFACLTFKRGIPWEFWPTTFLAQCDSCIGGKAGLNYGNVKNQLAVFSAPASVEIMPAFLTTLADAEIRSGLGESLKLHITGGATALKNFTEVMALPTDRFERYRQVIWTALLIKKAVIEHDEFELDLRRSLNYGHTIGHALESLTQYAIPHGIAVSLGMVFVNELSVSLGLLARKTADHTWDSIRPLVNASEIQLAKSVDLSSILGLLAKDKKSVGGQATFILLTDEDRLRFQTVPIDARLESEIRRVQAGLSLTR